MNVRLKGEWEKWIKFFLKGISTFSVEETQTAKSILIFKTNSENELKKFNNMNYTLLLDKLFYSPLITKKETTELLNISFPTVSRIIDDFCDLNILEDITPNQKRNKKYQFSTYVFLLNRGTELTM